MPILLKLYRCFCHDLKICMWFGYYPEIIFCHFFCNLNLVIFKCTIMAGDINSLNLLVVHVIIRHISTWCGSNNKFFEGYLKDDFGRSNDLHNANDYNFWCFHKKKKLNYKLLLLHNFIYGCVKLWSHPSPHNTRYISLKTTFLWLQNYLNLSNCLI